MKLKSPSYNLAICLLGLLIASGISFIVSPNAAQGPTWSASYTVGSACTSPTAANFCGGVEGRQFAALNIGLNSAKLYWAQDYWNDTPGGEGTQNAYIAICSAPPCTQSSWSKAYDMGAYCPADDTICAEAVGAMQTLTFSYDSGNNSVNVTALVASTWWTGTSALVGCFSPDVPVYVFDRNNTDALLYPKLLYCDPNGVSSAGNPQVRSFGTHVDQVLGTTQWAFAGEAPTGVFHGQLSTTRGAGNDIIQWTGTDPEWLASSYVGDSCQNQIRPMAFTEATGGDAVSRVYMSACWNVYVRIDGPSPGTHSCTAQQVDDGSACVDRWQLYWSAPAHGTSQSGLRGLTAVQSASTLVTGAEGSGPMTMWRITPYPACATPADPTCRATDYGVITGISAATNLTIGNTVQPYNNLQLAYDSSGTGHRLVSSSSFVTSATSDIPAFSPYTLLYWESGATGKKLAEGCYFFRTTSGAANYNFQCIPQLFPTAMNGVRDIIPSPWPAECNFNQPPGSTNNPGYNCAYYATGFDSDGATTMYWCQASPCVPAGPFPAVHNTAWIARYGY